jgi:hypothetical protein
MPLVLPLADSATVLNLLLLLILKWTAVFNFKIH